jgi:hypothetical protein
MLLLFYKQVFYEHEMGYTKRLCLQRRLADSRKRFVKQRIYAAGGSEGGWSSS